MLDVFISELGEVRVNAIEVLLEVFIDNLRVIQWRDGRNVFQISINKNATMRKGERSTRRLEVTAGGRERT